MMFECIDKIYPSVSIDTVTGSICSFKDEYGGLPLKSCTSLITGYQEGSGVPSPSNVRPLHAWSGASLGKCDNNTTSLWTIDNSFNGDVEFNQLLPSRTVEDTNTTTSWKNKGYALVNVLNPTHKYFISLVLSKTGNGIVRLRYPIISILSEGTNSVIVRGDVAGISYQSQAVENDSVSYSITNENVIDLTQMFGSTIADYIYSLETSTLGSGVAFFKALYPNGYYPYNAGTKQLVGDTLATFTFGQSIYQGSIDWKRGVAVGTWGYIASYNGETLTGEWLCNKAPYEVGTTPPTGSQVAYELATPIEIPLGGINLLTQEGVNNIFCDTGNTTVEYIKIV